MSISTDHVADTLTPSTGTITIAGVLASTGFGTGVATALTVDIGSAGSVVTNGGALGTPSSGTLTNCTFPTLNQNTTGSAAKWTTARNLAGNSVDGSANVTFANKFIVQGTTDTGLTAAQFLGALGTGIVKNTTTTGVLSIAVAGDFPTLNQSTTGSAATLTTARSIYGNNFDGSAAVTGTVTVTGVTSSGAITSSSASAGIGYATGAGGTVTQATSKSTAATLDKVTGKITMNGAALAAATVVTFVFNNSTLAAEDQIVCTHHATGTFGAYTINARVTGAGAASIAVRNNTAGSLSEAIVIKYTVIKAVAA